MYTRSWRTPAVILLCGSIVVLLALGILAATLHLPIDEQAVCRTEGNI
jgi:hypothetical protein